MAHDTGGELFRNFNDMIGHSELLNMHKAIDHYKTLGLDYTNIFYQPQVADTVGRYRKEDQKHGLEKSLDKIELLRICAPALERGERVVTRGVVELTTALENLITRESIKLQQ